MLSYDICKQKESETILQTLFQDMNVELSIEPITGMDLYYSDGSVQECIGKLLCKDKKQNRYYTVYLNTNNTILEISKIPDDYKKIIQQWLDSLNNSIF